MEMTKHRIDLSNMHFEGLQVLNHYSEKMTASISNFMTLNLTHL